MSESPGSLMEASKYPPRKQALFQDCTMPEV